MVAAQSYRALNWWLSFHGAREMLAWSSDAPSLQNNFIRVVSLGMCGWGPRHKIGVVLTYIWSEADKGVSR